MDICTVFWRLPADLIPRPGETSAEILDLVHVHAPSGRFAELIDPVNGWEVASHTLAFDLEGPVLSMVFVRYPDEPDRL